MTSFQMKLIKIVCNNFKIKPKSNEKLNNLNIASFQLKKKDGLY